MNSFHAFSLLAAAIAISFSATAKGSDLEETVRRYLAAKEAVQQADSDAGDVERLLAFVTDDVRGQHLKYDVSACEDRGGKARFRKGLMHHMDSYLGTDIEIREMMEGLNAIAVKFDETVKYRRDGKVIEETDHKMFVFEFENGLVSVIRRYY